jgi:hypothetical protein
LAKPSALRGFRARKRFSWSYRLAIPAPRAVPSRINFLPCRNNVLALDRLSSESESGSMDLKGAGVIDELIRSGMRGTPETLQMRLCLLAGVFIVRRFVSNRTPRHGPGGPRLRVDERVCLLQSPRTGRCHLEGWSEVTALPPLDAYPLSRVCVHAVKLL